MKKSSTGIQPLNLMVLTLMLVYLVACGPATHSTFIAPEASPVVTNQVPSQVPLIITNDSTEPAKDLPTPVVVATSRGPNLEATDPSSVSLASGQLQLVEFFRFT